MPRKVCLGKKAAIVDHRIPRMSVATRGRLPAPPVGINNYAAVDEWGILLNDDDPDCVQAAILHAILQMSTYALTQTLTPTDAEAAALFAATGSADGSYVLGAEGVVPFWIKHGVTCGGVLNKAAAFMQITQANPVEWMQAIWLFGGMLTGILLPESIVATDDTPYVWRDFSGPAAGGHEIWINGYGVYDGELLFDLISWGARYRASVEFLKACVDETVVVVDSVAMNSVGLNQAGLNTAQLAADMRLLF